ncbi:class I SAM-dependent methyltransferase [Candidatus Woesearchaeota archaeon]|nr:class I SAM-dependent methyltransferase [Candidatus Woesearchaeota archaeon]
MNINYFEKKRIFFRRLKKHRTVLDIGCGTGLYNSRFIKKMYPGCKICCVDLHRSIKHEFEMSYFKVELEKEKLPFKDNFFDAIIMTHVLEHLKNTDNVAKEIKRVLKPGGEIYIETPNWTTLLIPSFGINRKKYEVINFFDEIDHKRPWTKQALYSFITDVCELESCKVGSAVNWPKFFLEPFFILFGVCSRNRGMIASSLWNVFSGNIYCIGRKEK